MVSHTENPIFWSVISSEGVSPRPIICFIALMTNILWGFYVLKRIIGRWLEGVYVLYAFRFQFLDEIQKSKTKIEKRIDPLDKYHFYFSCVTHLPTHHGHILNRHIRAFERLTECYIEFNKINEGMSIYFDKRKHGRKSTPSLSTRLSKSPDRQVHTTRTETWMLLFCFKKNIYKIASVWNGW